MTNDIDAIRGYNPPSAGGSGGMFLKFADGDTCKVRLASLPVIFQNSFEDQKTGEVKLSTQFGFLVYNHDLEKAQIWITNGATYGQQIAPLLEDDEYGDWREYNVKITRTGEKAQTRYSVRPSVKHYELSADQQKAIEAIDIIAKIGAGRGASQVMWLSEYRELEEQGKQRAAQDAGAASQEEIVDNDVGDEPINLDDIPF